MRADSASHPSSRSARRALRAAAALVVAALAHAAAAQPDVPAIVARRTTRHVRLDGRLDDEAWREAPPFSAFVESFPRPGVAASFPTEVRVLYDRETLYVGVRCSDPDPAAIVRQLARRDSDTAADRVELAVNTGSNGQHTAFDFSVNAAGVLRDQLLFADVNATDSWDAVWDAAVARTDDGWSAEIAIPFRQLRFSGTRSRWAVVVRRVVPRTHQVFDSTLIPREANPVNPGGLVVSRFGWLDGVAEVQPRHGLELVPYAALRATSRPQYSDPARPDPRLVDPALDFGLDFRTALGRRLTLTGALNPDFGQVETDKVIQNLQNAEPYFPEKRPFFLEGLDIFQPVGSEYGSPQQLFYSRRIGLDAPILGAAKVTGGARDGLNVGVLDSIVMGAGNAALVPIGYSNPGAAELAPYEAHPDRRWRFRWTQPFHLGPEDALPSAHPVTTNYFAGVARQAVGGGATLGATFTAATPLEDRCARREFASAADYVAAACASSGGNAAGLDLNVPGEWGGFAQLEASQAVGGPAAGRTLQDGTVIRPGDLGFGGHMRAGKLGGEPWRWDVTYVYEDPKLDLNHVGFQPLSNYQWADLDLHYVRPSGFGPFHAFQLDYVLDVNWTADGEGLPRGVNSSLYSKLQLPGYQTIGMRVGVELPQYDTREIAGSGVPFERYGDVLVALELGSDPNRTLQASGDVFAYRTLATEPFAPQTGWGVDLSASWRPHDRLETRIDGSYGHKPQGPRWVDTVGDLAVFGLQDPEFLSVTLRQQLMFTPHLSAQLYAQLFSSAIRYARDFYGASIAGRRHLSVTELAPVAYAADPDSHDAVLNVNAVVRWEYRLGSTLYFVYTRSQSELPPVDGSPPSRMMAPSSLLRGPTTETLLVKWSWWFDR